MTFKSLLSSAVCVFALSSAPAFAQSPTENAQSAMGTYISIIAVAKTCAFDVAEPVRNTISANMQALQAKAGMDDAQVGAGIKGGIDKATEKKDAICAMGKEKFDTFLTNQAALAATAATAAGVTVSPLPTAAAPAPAAPAPAAPTADAAKKEATDLLALSHLVELISDECEIELTDDETAKLEKAQAYYRGKADVTEDQVTAMSDAMEKEVKKNRKEFCSPSFEFKSNLKTVLNSVK